MEHQKYCRLLRRCGIDFFVGVPCSTLGSIIDFLSEAGEFEYVPATREDEAIGIAAGAYMGGKTPAVLMQNSGLGVSVNALASLVLLYKLPMLLIVSWRGYKGEDASEHLSMGEFLPGLLRVMNVSTTVLSEEGFEGEVRDSVQLMKERGIPVVQVLRRGVVR
ncbi:sulfopyruvate decarboxylase subunit alpha [Candidatus Bathyarchaeota archaeon]|nr:sulfopyruvate decarboxylase subunit alpha [Candidatus Bathyarchaeota archaeon]